MYKILRKEKLNPTVTRMEILAPEVAAKAEPGQFIILRPQADSEAHPADRGGLRPRKRGSVTIIFQIVGATTAVLNSSRRASRSATSSGRSAYPRIPRG